MSRRQEIVARQMLEAINFLLVVASREKIPVVVARLIEVKLELETIAVANDRRTGAEPQHRTTASEQPSVRPLKRRPDAA